MNSSPPSLPTSSTCTMFGWRRSAAMRPSSRNIAAKRSERASGGGSGGGSGGDQQSGGACPAKAPVDAQTQAASRQVASGAEANAKDKTVGSGAVTPDPAKAAARGLEDKGVDKSAADKAATDKA